MRVVHVIESLHQANGGPAHSTAELVREHESTGRIQSSIIAFNLPHRGPPLEIAPGVRPTLVTPAWPYLLGRSPRFTGLVREALTDPQTILHLHGMWRMPFVVAARTSSAVGRPYVVSPHGSLQPWARTIKRWRKAIAWKLAERRRLEGAAVLHAASRQEEQELRDLLPNSKIVMIPIAISVPENLPVPQKSATKHAVFLSRIVPNKGVELLLRAWAQAKITGWKLTIAGPDEGGLVPEYVRLTQVLGLAADVKFVGAVHGTAKWELLSTSDLFILPSLGESFGIVVGEALGAGLPVITTRGVPWPEIESEHCGWWIDHGVESLARALSEACGLSREHLRQMGELGRRIVRDRFSPQTVGVRMAELYESVLGRVPG
jgi:glycosyltransferase involved in cell wall biosynthesis